MYAWLFAISSESFLIMTKEFFRFLLAHACDVVLLISEGFFENIYFRFDWFCFILQIINVLAVFPGPYFRIIEIIHSIFRPV